VHPEETETIGIESQFYFGDALLVSPVTAENSTSVTIYVPNEVFYDFFTLDAVNGTGSEVTIDNVGYETMPLHIRGGSIVPLRTGDAMTTGENRDLPFHLVIAPNRTNEASGTLRLDDGISLDVGDAYSDIEMTFKDDQLELKGTFGYELNNNLDMIVFAGQNAAKSIEIDGQRAENQVYDSERKTLTAWNLGTTLKQMTVRLV
jgi:alpha-glucosidase